MKWARDSGSIIVPLAAAALITGLILLQPAKIMEGYDLARMHQCYKHDLRVALLAGEIPWWNPSTALGRPFLADIETASLYPPSWLVLPFGVTTGIILMVGLHLALAIAGLRRLGEQLGIASFFALVAGISFALSGALLGRVQAGQLQLFCVVCLWPWLWVSAARLQDEPGIRPMLRLAGWLAVAFLAGSPQILWGGLVAMGGWLLVRSNSVRAALALLPRLAAAGTLAAGLAAIQLLPFVELVQQGNRPLGNVAFATRGGQAGASWLTLLVPPGPWLHSDGEFNLHGGALFFVLACAAIAASFRQRNVRALAAAGLLGLILAAGDTTRVLPALAEWVPGFAGVRYPSRYALASMLPLALLAVWWLDQATREKRLGRVGVVACVGLQMVTLVVGLFAQSPIYRVPLTPTNEARLRSDLREERLPRDGAPPRVALPASLLRANAGAQSGVSTLTGFNNPALARTWTSLYLLAGESPPDFHRAEVKDDVIVKLNAQARYYSLSATLAMPGNKVHFAPPPVPRAFLSFATRRVAAWPEAVERVRDGHDFVRTALVEQDVALGPDIPGRASRAEIVAFGRNRIAVDYHSPAPGLLVLAEAWYPGWTARLNDSSELAVIPVNGWMRGVAAPAGTNQVVFAYRPTHWWLGLGLSVFSCGLTVLLWRRSADAIGKARPTP